ELLPGLLAPELLAVHPGRSLPGIDVHEDHQALALGSLALQAVAARPLVPRVRSALELAVLLGAEVEAEAVGVVPRLLAAEGIHQLVGGRRRLGIGLERGRVAGRGGQAGGEQQPQESHPDVRTPLPHVHPPRKRSHLTFIPLPAAGAPVAPAFPAPSCWAMNASMSARSSMSLS